MGTTYSILLTASNGGLLIGVIFYAILFLVFVGMAIHFIRAYFSSTDKKLESIGYLALALTLSGLVGHGLLNEYNLLSNSVYVEGTTIGRCRKGRIEFEYYLNDKRYTNCNSFAHPEQIKIPCGKFSVRVANYDPSTGRIDFDKPLTADSRNYE